MPCTTILVGKKASHDGSTIISRNDDGGFEAKRLVAHPAREKSSTYKTVISHLTVELPGNALRYTDCPNVSKANGCLLYTSTSGRVSLRTPERRWRP